ncbi:L,D-transpeptidase/peptidoglycan binding protein [Brachybacterium sp. JHP9]|uniref:L,D-transpeptidase/peptidoglycan binding protein n=1 Tax=Brachybacterium equifaecis TaxID=2910770 RepID=A0ABT0QX68_9MICO|nr:L,D-transpeptidase family protein [Brachybacterium equifaecis]MCL6422094.1 L,D-transpeptidase/peptidoglycan binding protein [Brachybacterium equifaecis]
MSQLTAPAGPSGRADTSSPARRRALLILIAALAVVAVVLTGGAFAYAKSFEGKALPGTTVLGQDVSGMTPEQVAALVQERADATEVTVDADGTAHTATLADLGVSVDAAATAEAAASHDGSVTEVLSSTWSGSREVAPVVSVDENAVHEFAKGLVPADRTAPVDAQLTYDKDAGAWTVTPGQDGQGVDASSLVDAVRAQAPALESFTVSQPITATAPAITTESAEETRTQIQGILDQPMSIAGPKGTTYEVSPENRSSWISVAPDESGTALAISVDEQAVRDWVAGRAGKSTVEAKDGIEQVDANGTVVKVVTEKKDGVEVTNTDAVADQLIASLSGATPLEAAFETKAVPAKVTQAKAPAAETPADPAAPAASAAPAAPTGEKWIDVDLTAKTVTAYVGDTPVWGPRAMVDGKAGNETVTGTYKIYLRYEKQDMTNEGYFPKDHPKYYYIKDVPWVQYFYNGYGFHGAPWRSSFGYSGSHGCINLPVSDAKWLYDWASKGTRVESHR